MSLKNNVEGKKPKNKKTDGKQHRLYGSTYSNLKNRRNKTVPRDSYSIDKTMNTSKE